MQTTQTSSAPHSSLATTQSLLPFSSSISRAIHTRCLHFLTFRPLSTATFCDLWVLPGIAIALTNLLDDSLVVTFDGPFPVLAPPNLLAELTLLVTLHSLGLSSTQAPASLLPAALAGGALSQLDLLMAGADSSRGWLTVWGLGLSGECEHVCEGWRSNFSVPVMVLNKFYTWLYVTLTIVLY